MSPHHSHDPDAEIAGFLKGDPRVVGMVREGVERVVRSFQFPTGGLSRDLVQDTLTRVFENLAGGQFRGDASLKTYARRVARYTCLEYLRRRRYEVDLDPDRVPSSDTWSAPEESFLWTEEHLHNLEIFSCLTPDCREILRLVFIERLPYREIAGQLGISEGAVKTRVHRCRVSFRKAAGLSTPLPSRATHKKVPR